jgi:hypothetical protein
MEAFVKKNLEYRGLKSTELLILLLLVALGTMLAFYGKLTDQWVNLVIFLFGSFVVGRVGSKGAEAYKEAKQPQSNYTPGVV